MITIAPPATTDRDEWWREATRQLASHAPAAPLCMVCSNPIGSGYFRCREHNLYAHLYCNYTHTHP